jgi:hypothetical protein
VRLPAAPPRACAEGGGRPLQGRLRGALPRRSTTLISSGRRRDWYSRRGGFNPRGQLNAGLSLGASGACTLGRSVQSRQPAPCGCLMARPGPSKPENAVRFRAPALPLRGDRGRPDGDGASLPARTRGFDPLRPLCFSAGRRRAPPLRSRGRRQMGCRAVRVHDLDRDAVAGRGRDSSWFASADRRLQNGARGRDSLPRLHALVRAEPGCRLLSDVSPFDSERAYPSLCPGGSGREPPKLVVSVRLRAERPPRERPCK